jgi:hypothetical protein
MTFVPGEETMFQVFEARSLAALQGAARDASLQCERIVESGRKPARLGP